MGAVRARRLKYVGKILRMEEGRLLLPKVRQPLHGTKHAAHTCAAILIFSLFTREKWPKIGPKINKIEIWPKSGLRVIIS